MGNKSRQAQLTNVSTYRMYLRQFMTLAENVFQFKNLSNYIFTPFLNKQLINVGSIAFFYDDVLESLLALPYESIGKLDIYERPQKIKVISPNGSYNRILNKDEFVIMYDNNAQYPLFIDIKEYAERYALLTRTCDVNAIQQRTPRIWNVPKNYETTFKDIINNIDSLSDSVTTYDTLNFEEITCILQPSPYIIDKIEEEKRAIKAEFLELIGISHIQFNKRERLITDEVIESQGNTIASRFSRFEPRKKAIDEINKKFGKYLTEPIEVFYYDSIPSSTEGKKNIDKEMIEDDF